MLVLISGGDDLGESRKITVENTPDWAHCWGRWSKGDVFIHSHRVPSADIFMKANLVVYYIYPNMLESPKAFEIFCDTVSRIQCPIVFEWCCLMEKWPYSQYAEHLPRFLQGQGDKVMFDYYADPNHCDEEQGVGLRSDLMVNCRPVTFSKPYFDTNYHKWLYPQTPEKDGTILVIHAPMDHERNGYWSHKYASDLAELESTKYYTHQGYSDTWTGYAHPFLSTRCVSIRDGENLGMSQKFYEDRVRHSSLAIVCDSRPWMGRFAMDLAAAQTPLLCTSDNLLHRVLFGHIAAPCWHDYKSVIGHGRALMNGEVEDAGKIAYDNLNLVDGKDIVDEVHEKLGVSF